MNVLLCPLSDPGFLYPSIAVGRELRREGATVHVVGSGELAPVVAAAELPFVAAESCGVPGESMRAVRWFREGAAQYRLILRAAREVRADVLVTSVLCHGALLAAEILDLPVVVIGLAAHLWEYRVNSGTQPESAGLRVWRAQGMLGRYDLAREQAGLAPRPANTTRFPLAGSAFLLQGDPAFEDPGAELPEWVHHAGPCTWEPPAGPEELGAIVSRLDQVGKPVVYVHLGRVDSSSSPWPRINAAFTRGPFQAVVELGRSDGPRPAPDADLVVVRKPWMGPLLDRAGLVLTTGTSAPVLNALLRGRALGVSPHGSEQVLLSQACVRAGVAVYVPDSLDSDPAGVLRSAWQDAELRSRAGQVGRRLTAAGRATLAASVVQRSVTGRSCPQPVALP